MKISKSKQELARIISENGGWREGAGYLAMDTSGMVCGYLSAPKWSSSLRERTGSACFRIFISTTLAPNHQRTILSSEEYSHLYPAPDDDGWIEWKGGECPVDKYARIDIRMTGGTTHYDTDTHWGWNADSFKITHYRLHKPEQAVPEFCESVMRSIPEPDEQVWTNPPSIEQLAADYRNAKDYAERKQQEADAAKADADEMLRVLEIAGEALGLLVSPITERQEPELVITDWRDLQLNDIIEYVDGSIEDKIGMTGPVVEFAPDATDGMMVRMKCDNGPRKGRLGWPMKWRFIRRP